MLTFKNIFYNIINIFKCQLMPLTLWALLERTEKIAQTIWVWQDPEAIKDLIDEIQHIVKIAVAVQVFWKEALDNWWEISLSESEIINRDTILQIHQNLEETFFEDLLFANFGRLLYINWYIEDLETFNSLKYTYDCWNLEWLRNHISKENLLKNISKNSPLYIYLSLIVEWKDVNNSILIVLNFYWIDLNKNPLINIDNELLTFINQFNATLLATIWNWATYDEKTVRSTIN